MPAGDRAQITVEMVGMGQLLKAMAQIDKEAQNAVRKALGAADQLRGKLSFAFPPTRIHTRTGEIQRGEAERVQLPEYMEYKPRVNLSDIRKEEDRLNREFLRTLTTRERRQFDEMFMTPEEKQKARTQREKEIQRRYERTKKSSEARARVEENATAEANRVRQTLVDQETKLNETIAKTDRATRERFNKEQTNKWKREEDYRQRTLTTRQKRKEEQAYWTDAEMQRWKTERRQIAKDRSQKTMQGSEKGGSREIMGLASAGIGLFGQAGFPLLNVAFASMSGMKYAGIAAAATAIGELSRAINSLLDSSQQAAEKLNFVSKEMRIARIEFDAVIASIGGITNISAQRGLRERMQFWQGGGASIPAALFSNIRENLKNIYTSPANAQRGINQFNPTGVMGLVGQTIKDLIKAPEELRKARANMVREMFPMKVGLTKPEDMWARIQTSVGSKSVEKELNRKMLEMIDKQIASSEKLSKFLDRWFGMVKHINPTGSINLSGTKTDVMDVFGMNTFLKNMGAYQ